MKEMTDVEPMKDDDPPERHVDRLIYQASPVVTFATNKFVNVPVILQFDDTPLISVVREQQLGYTSQIEIYHSDGTYLAKVNGVRPFATEAGKKAGIIMRHPRDMTVCELNGRTVFEIYHQRGDGFRVDAELHTPNGCFVKSTNTPPSIIAKNGEPLQVGGITMLRNTFVGVHIGVWLKSDGSCAIGVNGPRK